MDEAVGKIRWLLKIFIMHCLLQMQKLPFITSTFLLDRVQCFSVLEHLRFIHSFQRPEILSLYTKWRIFVLFTQRLLYKSGVKCDIHTNNAVHRMMHEVQTENLRILFSFISKSVYGEFNISGIVSPLHSVQRTVWRVKSVNRWGSTLVLSHVPLRALRQVPL